MPDEFTEKIIIEATKAVAKDVYKDGLQPVVKGVGGVLGTVATFFDKVIFFPMKKLNMHFETKLIELSMQLEAKVNKIPEEFQKEPPINILGPTLEGLKYNIDEKELKEMYLNLLSSSMDNRKDKLVHPSYVRIIERMDELDAKLFKVLQKVNGYENVVQPKIEIGNNQVLMGLPEFLLDYKVEGYDIFDISRSFIRLDKLGLITIRFNSKAGGKDAIFLLERQEIQNILISAQVLRNMPELKLEGTNHAFLINDFGKGFSRVCL